MGDLLVQLVGSLRDYLDLMEESGYSTEQSQKIRATICC